MPTKKMSLRYAGTCRSCGVALGARTMALYHSDSMTISCLECGDTTFDPAALAPSIDRGTPGAGSQHEYQRRIANREAQIEQRWGRLASIVRLMSDEPQSTAAWKKGADGERRLGAHLERELGGSAILLHSRRVPHSSADIDHIAVAPSGVWIVDAKNHKGKVERRDLGGRRNPDPRLFVNGRDHTSLVSGLSRQLSAVSTALEPLDSASPPIHRVLLFTDSDWGLFGKPFAINGVWVLWAKRLCQLILEPGSLEPDTVDAVVRHLSAALPAKI
jgi:Nuclease-related domain